MNNSSLDILLINPWAYDFKAYDFWLKPLGLLYLADFLKKLGLSVQQIHYFIIILIIYTNLKLSIFHKFRRLLSWLKKINNQSS